MPDSHDLGEAVDEALTTSRDGMRALWNSLTMLGVTAAVQAIVVWISGSVALLGDTVHNLGDALTAISSVPATMAGFPLADPLVGLAITATLCLVLLDAAREVYRRLIDCVDPELVIRCEGVLEGIKGVDHDGRVRVRGIGHKLHADIDLVLPEGHPAAGARCLCCRRTGSRGCDSASDVGGHPPDPHMTSGRSHHRKAALTQP